MSDCRVYPNMTAFSYPRWVQRDGKVGTTVWSKEQEDEYYADPKPVAKPARTPDTPETYFPSSKKVTSGNKQCA